MKRGFGGGSAHGGIGGVGGVTHPLRGPGGAAPPEELRGCQTGGSIGGKGGIHRGSTGV